MLAVRGVVKSFGGRAILRGADLDVEPGARIGVLGPNGGGKSTLLRIVAGLDHADAGTVTRRRGLVLAHLPQIVDGDERDALATVRDARPELAALERELARRRGAPGRPAARRRPRRDDARAGAPRAAAGALDRGRRRPRRGRGARPPARARDRRPRASHARAERRPAQARRARRLPRAAARRAAARRARGPPRHGAPRAARRAARRLRRRGRDDLPRPPPARRERRGDRRARRRRDPDLARQLQRLRRRPPARARTAAPAVRHAAEGDRAPGRGRAALPPLGAHPRQRARRAPGAREADADRPHGEDRAAGVRAPPDGARRCAPARAAASACSRSRASTRATATIPSCSTSSSWSCAASASASSGPTAAARRRCCGSWPRELAPAAGTRWAGDGITVGYLSQAAGALRDDATVLDALRAGRSMAEDAAVRLLMGFLFDYEQCRRPVGSLSGGERTRLAFLCLMQDAPELPRARRAHQPPRHRLDRSPGGRLGALRRHRHRRLPRPLLPRPHRRPHRARRRRVGARPSRAAGRPTPTIVRAAA